MSATILVIHYSKFEAMEKVGYKLCDMNLPIFLEKNSMNILPFN